MCWHCKGHATASSIMHASLFLSPMIKIPFVKLAFSCIGIEQRLLFSFSLSLTLSSLCSLYAKFSNRFKAV